MPGNLDGEFSINKLRVQTVWINLGSMDKSLEPPEGPISVRQVSWTVDDHSIVIILMYSAMPFAWLPRRNIPRPRTQD